MITYDYILGLKENHNISFQLDHKQHFTPGYFPQRHKNLCSHKNLARQNQQEGLWHYTWPGLGSLFALMGR